MQEWAVRPLDLDPSSSTSIMRAPCCGRHTPADTIVSLAGLQTEIRGGNYRPKENIDWACDGCIHILIADKSNGWTWSNLFSALGAPDPVIRHYLALEVLKEAELSASAKGEWVTPGEVYDVAYASLPIDLTNDRATQRPDTAAVKT
jgi:hypothetical protein